MSVIGRLLTLEPVPCECPLPSAVTSVQFESYGLLHAPAEANLRLRKQIKQRDYWGAYFRMPQVGP